MDGILFDSMPYHAAAWVKAFSELDIPFTEYDAYMNEGRTGASTVQEFFKLYKHRLATDAEIDAIYERKSRLFNENNIVRRIDGVSDLIDRLRHDGITIFVVTGSGQRSLLDTLDLYFPDVFKRDRMITAFDVKYGKPDPEPYLMALKKANVTPNEAIVIENAPLGIKSGTAAGIFTVAVNTGILSDEVLTEAGADIILKNMNALEECYSELFR